MIIGQYIDVYPPEIDGVGRVANSYAEELSAMGDECYYIAPRAPETGEMPDYRTLLYSGIKMPDEPYRIGTPILDFKYLIQKERIPFDIVHAHSPFIAGSEALLMAARRNIPVVATFHSKYYDDFYTKTHSRVLASFGTYMVVNFYNKCDEVWAVNERTADVLHEYGYRREILVMPNGTDAYTCRPEEIAETKQLYDLGEDPTFLFVGQMNWKKNIRRTLQAVALFSRERRCRMLMVGQGPDEHEIARYVHELGLSDIVVFTGHIADRDRLMSIYACADLMVFPSVYDNAPMVVREAAVMGTPSILMRNTCAAEGIVDGSNGLLCDDSPESICECMKRGLENRAVLGEEARKTIPLQWSGIIQKARDRYLYLIEEKKRTS